MSTPRAGHDPADGDPAELLERFEQLRQTGSRSLRNQLVTEHLSLAEACARRFANRGEPLDDLEQVAMVGLVTVVVMILASLAAPLLARQDPSAQDLAGRLAWPSAAHWFGTDQSGRDVFSRVVHGAGRSVGIGLLATALALAAGLVLGALSGIAPRGVDAAAMRVNDVLMAFPEFLVALVVVAVLGPGPVNVAIAVTLAAVPVYVRLARVQTRTLVLAEHVDRPLRRAGQAAQHPQHGRLPGTVRAEQRGHARADGERHVRHGDHVAEPLRDPVGDDHRVTVRFRYRNHTTAAPSATHATSAAARVAVRISG